MSKAVCSSRNTRGASIIAVDDDLLVQQYLLAVLQTFEKPEQDNQIDADLTALKGKLGWHQQSNPTSQAFPLVRRFEIVGSGEEAIACADKIAREDPPLDLLFCDMRMPGMSGLETAKRILEKYPHTSLTFITGFSDFSLSYLEKQLNRKVGLITKPFRRNDMKNILLSCLGSREP